MNTFGKNVKRIREAKGLSQDELAKRAGYTSRSTISCIESGKRDCSQKQIFLIANALGVSPGELFGKQEVILGTEIRKIIKKISNEIGERYDDLENIYITKEFPHTISYKSLLYFFSIYLDKPLCIGENKLSNREENLIINYRKLTEQGRNKIDEYAEDLLGMKRVYRAARSADNHPAEITTLTKEEQERIDKAPKVTSENSNL